MTSNFPFNLSWFEEVAAILQTLEKCNLREDLLNPRISPLSGVVEGEACVYGVRVCLCVRGKGQGGLKMSFLHM